MALWCPECGSEDIDVLYEHDIPDEDLIEVVYECYSCKHHWIVYREMYEDEAEGGE